MKAKVRTSNLQVLPGKNPTLELILQNFVKKIIQNRKK